MHYIIDTFRRDLRNFIQNVKTGRVTFKEILLWIGAGISALFIIGAVLFLLAIAILSIGLPDVKDLYKLSQAQSTTLYDREGKVLYVKHGAENREYVPYEKISKNIIDATVAIEDHDFWNHNGFYVTGLMRAFLSNISRSGPVQGASTITQQYVKNTFLSSEKSAVRKLKELILSVQLEQTYSKEKILELYLNKISYSNNAYGVEKAAQIYFNKHAADVDLAEGTVLASIVNNPTHYNPYVRPRSALLKDFTPEEISYRNINSESALHDDEFARGLIGNTITLDSTHSFYLQGRTDLVLKAMQKYGYIDEATRQKTLKELQKMIFTRTSQELAHAHFIFYVLDQLSDKYDKELIEQGGLKVYTSLDPTMQDIAENVIKEGALANEKAYNARNASLVSMDPTTGEILAMVGSRDYNDTKIDGAVNVATTFQDPGSSFKPFTYAQAFYNRFSPSSLVFDTQTRIGSNAFPKDFDGKFRGPMTIREALGQSRNIPAIKAYFLAGQQEPIMQLAEKMGIHFKESQRHADIGWPLSLGGIGVRLIDMVAAYSAFANTGIKHDPVSILRVENAQGQILEQWKLDKGKEVIDPQVAFLINSILSDTSVRLSENLTIPGQVNAAKTGTSNRKDKKNNYYPHDLWTMGYTTKLVTGVWVGNNTDDEGNISTAADGVNAAARIWKKFMVQALQGKPSEPFPKPPGIREMAVSKITGKLPGPNTPANQITTAYFADFAVPTEVDDSNSVVKVDTRNDKLANEYCPPAFVAEKAFLNLHDIAPYPEWEKGAQDWLTGDSWAGARKAWIDAHVGDLGVNIAIGQPPLVESELCSPDFLAKKPTIIITEPQEDLQVLKGDTVQVKVEVEAALGVSRVEFYLDGQYHYFSDVPPYDGSVRLPKADLGVGKHIISVKVIDNFGYSSDEEQVTVRTH